MRSFFCVALLLSSLAAAQTKNPRSCRILYLGAPDGAPETLELFDGAASRPVELARMNFSPVYRLPAGPLVLRLLPAPPAKPAEVNPDAPKIAVPEGVDNFYLLVSTDTANQVAPVKMQVIDANPENFRKGQMLWFNLTANSIGGQVGGLQLAMPANSRKILDAPAAANEDFNVNLSYRMPGNERLYPLCETKWLHDTRARTVYFVLTQEGNRTPRVMGFPDYRESAETAAKP